MAAPVLSHQRSQLADLVTSPDFAFPSAWGSFFFFYIYTHANNINAAAIITIIYIIIMVLTLLLIM